MSEYILKVLSGPHTGASIALGSEPFSIGRDLSCDIILSEAALAPSHVIATVDSDGIHVQNLDGPISVNGTAVSSVNGAIPLLTPLIIGNTAFAIGLADSDWEAINYSAASKQADESEGKTQSADTLAVETPVVAPASISIRRLSIYGIAATLVLGGLVGLTQATGTNSAQDELILETVEPAAGSQLHAIQNVIDEFVASNAIATDLQLVSLGAGGFVLRGYVNTIEQRNTLASELEGYTPSLVIEVFAADQLMTSVTNTLAALGRDLVVNYSGPGTIRLEGYIEDASDLQRVVDIVKRDVAGLRNIENRVISNRLVFDRLDGMIRDAGLADGIKIRLDGERILARGVVSNEKTGIWDEVQNEFADRYGEYLRLVSQVQMQDRQVPRALPAPSIELPIIAARSGRMPYVILEGGQKYLVGSTVLDGWRIVTIDRTAVVLERDGRRVIQPL